MLGVTDYHTAGEPFRIVTAGAPEIAGKTVAERRERAIADEQVQFTRRLLVQEPRGHADMYGCFLVPADDDGAQLGVLFWHKDGFSTACGHGTIALGAWAVNTGLVPAAHDGDTTVVIDVPSGRVSARVTRVGGRVTTVAFRNVPSSVVARDIEVQVGDRTVRADVSYGGARYASVRSELPIEPGNVTELTALGRAVKWALDDRFDGIYGTILYENLPRHPHGPAQRNVTIFADGEVDRSPCGSGTSARLALLAADGLIGPDEWLRHESIIGTTFLGRIVGEDPAGVVTEVEGMAYQTGGATFTLDDHDPLGAGFVLR
jgi:proline racemase